MLEGFAAGIPVALQPVALLWTLFGVVWGILAGALPGITGSIGMALLLPLTFGMDSKIALMMLASVYIGSMYGGSHIRDPPQGAGNTRSRGDRDRWLRVAPTGRERPSARDLLDGEHHRRAHRRLRPRGTRRAAVEVGPGVRTPGSTSPWVCSGSC